MNEKLDQTFKKFQKESNTTKVNSEKPENRRHRRHGVIEGNSNSHINDTSQNKGVTHPELINKENQSVNDAMTPTSGIEQKSGAGCVGDIYYDSIKREYVVQNSCTNRWKSLNATQLRNRLKSLGYASKIAEGEMLSELDLKVVELEDEKDVSFVGKLAGHPAGYFDQNGIRGVVTEGYTLPYAEEGECSTIGNFLKSILVKGSQGNDQLKVFIYWLKTAYESLKYQQHQIGQCLIIAGEAGCGKSQLQKFITLALGGRQASGYNYMSGATTFNEELCESEHLILDDENSKTNHETRLQLAANIKKHVVGNNIVTYHGKGRKGIPVSPWWRLSISLNENAERLRAIPPLDEDFRDKVILLRAFKQQLPIIDGTPKKYAELWDTIEKELPAFLHKIEGWEISDKYKCPLNRYRVISYHNPDLAEELSKLNPQRKLLEIIDDYLWTSGDHRLIDTGDSNYWIGGAKELRGIFMDAHSRNISREFNEVIKSDQSLGTYLGRLADSKHAEEAGRVERARTSDKRGWKIHRPTI